MEGLFNKKTSKYKSELSESNFKDLKFVNHSENFESVEEKDSDYMEKSVDFVDSLEILTE